MPPAPWPAASPSVYEDLLGYVLWPTDYADRLWGHGYGDMMTPLLAPAAGGGKGATLAVESGMCSAKASELADGLIKRTAANIAPNAEQQAALDSLRAAMAEAIERGRAHVCGDSGDPLDRTVAGLWTMWDATLLLRPPLERFYSSLTPEQQAKLAGSEGLSHALAQACTNQRPFDALDRAAQSLPAEQRQRLEGLKAQSAGLAKVLAASCPKEGASTPIDRLKAATSRMNTLLYVATNVSSSVREGRASESR
jgi:hypothetical protein